MTDHREQAGGDAGRRSVLLAIGRRLDMLSTFLSYVSGTSFLALAFYISWEAVARKFGLPYTGASDELSGYTLAVAAALGLGHTLRMGEHVRIDVIVTLLPQRLQRVLLTVAIALVGLVAGLLFVYAVKLGLQSHAIGARGISRLHAPLAVPQFMVAFGLGVLTLQAAILTVTRVFLPEIAAGDSGGPTEIHQSI
ncbi:TRAP transporter small permease [Mesorhizobium sp. B2-6-1]|uniref:TRAP transporter small permease subunit n=1 Tax=Mesorhizobium sp. B2-6-1 TaxID=2589916 RepID=UPI00112B8927|nr:TRAP transporter small permease [Mesorhizobium sp. B2-6-1]TPJ57625.1 TRAP transporter small permease [Mesorhizobium sp. B2-6-1]